MGRECLLVVVLAPLAGCSLVLDFSESQIPIDAAADAPYTDDECAYKEPNDTVETAAMIDPATDMGPAAICASDAEDRDFYRFTVPADTASTTIRINFTNRPSGDIDLIVRDTTGTMLAQSRGFGDGETIVCPGASPSCSALTPGTEYVMEVFPALIGAVNSYDFAITFTPQ